MKIKRAFKVGLNVFNSKNIKEDAVAMLPIKIWLVNFLTNFNWFHKMKNQYNPC